MRTYPNGSARAHTVTGLLGLGLALITAGCADTSDLVGIDPEATRPHFDLLLGTETQITSDPATQDYPAISGERIVWVDYRNNTQGDIYMYDLTTGTETRITSDAAILEPFRPAISGDRIVWEDYRHRGPVNSNGDIYMYDLATGTEMRITSDATQILGRPAISGERIVWVDLRNGNADIYMYDLATGAEMQITSDPATQDYPAISGERIVWVDYRNNTQGDIYMYDLATGTETQITSNPSYQEEPAISGERIVWVDYRNRVTDPDNYDNNSDIYMYDLATGTETQITSNPAAQYSPAISGERIVWVDERHRFSFPTVGDIYMYDLATGTETRITSDAAILRTWWIAISGKRIVWVDGRNGLNNPDIYMFEIATSSFECIAVVRNKLNEYEAGGQVANAGVAKSLRALLDQAEAAAARGNTTAAKNTLEAFIRSVEAQSGHNIHPSAATTLEDMARAAIGCL